MLKIVIAATIIFFTGCAKNDPTLADSVDRKGNGIYKATSVGYIDGLDQAIKQCQMDGNKELKIITTSTEYNYVLKRDLTFYVFKCNTPKA